MSATVEELAQQEDLVEGSVALSLALLRDFFNGLDASMPGEQIRDLMIYFIRELLLETRGQVSVDALNFYEEQRAKFPQLAPLTEILEPVVDFDEGKVDGSIRWAVDPLFEEAETSREDALNRLEEVVDRWVRNAEAETILSAIESDPEPVGYYRMPEAGACGFCLMVASRGAVYESRESASTRTKDGEFKTYHRSCKCRAGVLFPGDKYPESYKPDELYDQWLDSK